VVLDAIDQRPSTRIAGIPASSTPAFRTLWRRDRNIKGGVLGKYQAALDAASKTRYTETRNPFKNAQLVVHLRNHFMHYKPEWRDADDENHFERALKKANVVENQQPIAGHWFPNKALGAGLADWSCDVATRFANSWWNRIGLRGKFDASFNQLPPP
jgi:hypothetical protein